MTALLAFLRVIPLWIYPVIALALWGWAGHREARIKGQQAHDAQQSAAVAREEARQRQEIANEQLMLADERARIAAADAEQAERNLAAANANRSAAERVYKRTADLVAASRAPAAASAVTGSAPADLLGAALKACVGFLKDVGGDAVDAIRRGERCSAEYQALTSREERQ